MNTLEMFTKCEPQNVETLILNLAREQKEMFESDKPISTVCFILTNGTSISGNYFKIKEERHDKTILLASNNNFTYIPMSMITGVQIHNPLNHLSLLSEGSIPFSDDTKPLGNLDLKRLAKATEKSFQDKLGLNLTLNFDFEKFSKVDAVNLNLASILENLGPALSELCSDEIGKMAIAGITEILFTQASNWNTKLNGSQITIGVDLEKSLPKELRTLIENSIGELF